MGQDRALGPARGARGVQDPHRIVAAGGGKRGLSAAGQPGGILVNQVQTLQVIRQAAVLPQRLQQWRVADQQADPCRAQLVGQLGRRQSGVQGYQDVPGHRDGVDEVQEIRAIPRQDRYPLAGGVPGRQSGCQPSDPLRQLGVAAGLALPQQGGRRRAQPGLLL